MTQTTGQQPRTNIFASEAKSGELSDFPNWKRGLGIAFDETNGFPEMSGINGLLQELHKNIRYLEEFGIGLWRDDIEYPIGGCVLHNYSIYKATKKNKAKKPDVSQDVWGSLFVDNLDSLAPDFGLSARQGRELDQKKISKADLVDNLTSDLDWTSVTARQSKILADGLKALKANDGQIEIPNFLGGKTVIVKFGIANFPDATTGAVKFKTPFPDRVVFAMVNDIFGTANENSVPCVMGWRLDNTTRDQLGFVASTKPNLFSYIAIGF